AQAGNAFQSIPPSVVYFANAFQIGPGVTMVLSVRALPDDMREIAKVSSLLEILPLQE
ncbi:hypothetical protein K3Z94_10280, partial [Pseudomonas aeruginosa]|nr:hypothetical protein [Pseudomonas aeruginosa]